MKKIVVMMLLGLLFVSNGIAKAEEATGPMEKLSMEQIDQLATGCKTELEAYCKDVTPGAGRKLACIYAHSDKLSPGCEKAQYDSAQEFSVAAAMLSSFAEACQADIKKLCSTVPAGEGRILKCLEENKEQISTKCNKACQQSKGGLGPKQVAA